MGNGGGGGSLEEALFSSTDGETKTTCVTVVTD
jgi:hypothetical protein